MKLTEKHEEYWRKHLVVTGILLANRFVVTFVTGNPVAPSSAVYSVGTMPSHSTARREKRADQQKLQSERSGKRHVGICWRGLR